MVMKYIVTSFVALFLLSSTIVFAAPPPWAGNPGGPGDGGGDSPPPANPIIIVDPGHGGTDSGSTECSGYPEKDANLDIAEKLETLLVNADYEVHLTRTNDSAKSNSDRYTFANSVSGDALVSIHLNGSTSHSANGTQGLYGKKNKDEAFTRTVHQALLGSLGVDDRGITNFPSGVLLKSNMPATLQEAVFISNTKECQLLTDGRDNGTFARQQEIAEALAQGINVWFGK
jgi:N-acetylmuramoyl-L-alanine amidase